MGFLTKGLTKAYAPQKKITNPLVKPRAIDPAKDIRREEKLKDVSIKGEVPVKLGELYSPIKSTVEQTQFGKSGLKGQNIEASINKHAPQVSGSEKAFANIKLEPQKRYTQDELLSMLENKADSYDVRVRQGKSSEMGSYSPNETANMPSAKYQHMQRQKIEDKELDYFELTVHTPTINPDVEYVTKGHFEGGVAVHTRVSLRQDRAGNKYILLEESQSDAARMAGKDLSQFRDLEMFDEMADEYDPQHWDYLASDPDFDQTLNTGIFVEGEGGDTLFTNVYLRSAIEDDPILSADLQPEIPFDDSDVLKLANNKKETKQAEILDEFRYLNGEYEGKEKSVLKEIQKYYSDIAAKLSKAQYEGEDALAVHGYIPDTTKVKGEDFPNDYFLREYEETINNDLFEENLALLNNPLEIKFDSDAAKKKAETLITDLKTKFPHLKDDEFFNYDFLTSRDADTLFGFTKLMADSRNYKTGQVLERELGGWQDPMTGEYTEGYLTDLDDVVFDYLIDPVNKIFSYAYHKDLINHAKTETQIGAADKPLVERLAEKTARIDQISKSIYDLNISAYTDNIKVKDARVKKTNEDRIAAEAQPEVVEEPVTKGPLEYEPKDIPINTRMETMLASLKSSIILAKKQGVNEIVIPDVSAISELRASDGTYDEAFTKLYRDGLRKALNQLQQDTKGKIKVGTRTLRHDPKNMGAVEPDYTLDGQDMWSADKYTESNAISIDISDLIFDPEKEALRFNMGGSVPPPINIISDEAANEARLAGVTHFNRGGMMIGQQMELFDEGGLRDEGGTVDPASGNDVPSGALQEEVADDVPAMLSEGEFVFPADVVRYLGLEKLMQMRQQAKQGLKMMEDMGQMGNSDEATIPDDVPFGMSDLVIVAGGKSEPKEMAEGGVLMGNQGLFSDPRFTSQTTNPPPTMTDADKAEIETAVLSGVFGDIVMKRYVNADGQVMYIPFIGGEPQAPIPEGFSPSDAPTASPSGAGGGQHTTEGSSREYQGEPNVIDQMQGTHRHLMSEHDKKFGPEGTVKSIAEMSDEDLVAYYEKFSSPVSRYASLVAGLLNPLMGVFTGIAQHAALKNSKTGLKATEAELLNRLKKGTIARDSNLFDRINKAKKLGDTKGYGASSIFSTILNKLTNSAKPEDKVKADALGKFLQSGVIDSNGKKNLASGLQTDYWKNWDFEDFGDTYPLSNDLKNKIKADLSYGDVSEFGGNNPFVFDYGYGTTPDRPPKTDRYTALTGSPFGDRGKQIKTSYPYGTVSEFGERTPFSRRPDSDFLTSTTAGRSKFLTPPERKAIASNNRVNKAVDNLRRTGSMGSMQGMSNEEKEKAKRIWDQTEAYRSRRGSQRIGSLTRKSGTKFAPDPASSFDKTPGEFDGTPITGAMQYAGLGYNPNRETEFGSAPQRDTYADPSIDDFFGKDFGQQTFGYNPPAGSAVSKPVTESDPWTVSNVADTWKDAETYGMFGNKGGLAKPKAKPKRMKKGGLASSKKKK